MQNCSLYRYFPFSTDMYKFQFQSSQSFQLRSHLISLTVTETISYFILYCIDMAHCYMFSRRMHRYTTTGAITLTSLGITILYLVQYVRSVSAVILHSVCHSATYCSRRVRLQSALSSNYLTKDDRMMIRDCNGLSGSYCEIHHPSIRRNVWASTTLNQTSYLQLSFEVSMLFNRLVESRSVHIWLGYIAWTDTNLERSIFTVTLTRV